MKKKTTQKRPRSVALPHREIQWLPLEKLAFDSQNPRLPRSADGSDESVVIAWMLAKANIVELMGSIAEQGYFEGEPLVVIPSKPAGSYEVVEGNRRLTAVKLLNNPALATNKKKAVQELSDTAKFRPDRLPCLVFDHREEILHFLAYRHIVAHASHVPLHPDGEKMKPAGKDKYILQGDINRRLSWRECAAIQGLPQIIKPSGSLVSKYRVVGNAVPPAFGKALLEPVVAAKI